MSILWSDVVGIAPGLASSASGMQAFALRFADSQIDDDAWGDTTIANDARAALAAHMATVFTMGGAAPGAIASETLGPMSRTYAVQQMTKSLLGTTKYGLIYLQMLSITPGALGFVP